MLVEVKAKVARIIDGKTRKKTETFIMETEVFSTAEYRVMTLLSQEQSNNLVEDFEIQSLRISPIREVCTQYQGNSTFIVSLRDTFTTDDGTEKPLRYKILLWANTLAEAHQYSQEIAAQGYDMHIEGIKEVEYEYLTEDTNEASIS